MLRGVVTIVNGATCHADDLPALARRWIGHRAGLPWSAWDEAYVRSASWGLDDRLDVPMGYRRQTGVQIKEDVRGM